MKSKRMFVAFFVVLLLALASVPTLRAADKDVLVVNATPSTPNGIEPFVPGQAPNQWFYHYGCVPTDTSLEDTLHVSFTLGNERGDSTPVVATVSFSVKGNPKLRDYITPPSSINVTAGVPTPVIVDIPIATPGLANGVYVANIQISVDPSKKVQLAHDTIHVQVRVAGNCGAPPPICFTTDSQFGALLDCSGDPVALESNFGGTFQIVVNAKKIVVATNPGQFYYNLIWTNTTGAPHNITLTMAKSDDTLVTTGTNALHAAVFESGEINPASPLVSQFDAVNTDGTPCGTGTTGSTPCKTTVTLGVGQTLWVTWHLAYAKIGLESSTVAPGACPGSELISATCTVSDTTATEQLTTCTAQASGFLKKQKE
jgi:hypothetical protein